MNIGITGPLGAGKDTAADYLAKKINGKHISGGDILREMLTTIGVEPKKSALGDFGTFLRTHYGKDFITNRYYEMVEAGQHLIANGFRSVVEAEGHKAHGALILYIDAPDTLRHARVGSRGRSDDSAHADDLKRLDAQEHASTAAMAENLGTVRHLADVVIMNDGTLEELHAKLDDFITQYVH
jgi:dephospho-CoA kinase